MGFWSSLGDMFTIDGSTKRTAKERATHWKSIHTREGKVLFGESLTAFAKEEAVKQAKRGTIPGQTLTLDAFESTSSYLIFVDEFIAVYSDTTYIKMSRERPKE